jgi:hypothetical protein
MQINFDPESLKLTINSSDAPRPVSAFDHIDRDILGKSTHAARPPGPLAVPLTSGTWNVDPRQATAAAARAD